MPGSRPSREVTRERVLDGAYKAFSEVGFQGATVEDVCSRAGFSRGAFYSNFSSLDELLLALWERQNDRLIATLEQMVDTHDSDAPFERAMVALVELRRSESEWFVIATEFLLHSLRHPELERKVAEKRVELRKAMRRGVEVLLAAQGRRPPAGMDVETFAELLIAGHIGCQHVAMTDRGAVRLPEAMLTALLAACPPAEPDLDPTQGV